MRVAVAIFGLSLLAYLLTSSGHLQTEDVRAELDVADSIVTRGDFTVPLSTASVRGIDGRLYTFHGVGESLLFLPVAAVRKVFSPDHMAIEFLASLINPLAAALTVAVLALFVLELGGSARVAITTALIFAFTTMEWAYAHNAFDVTPTAFFLLLSLFAARHSRVRDGPGWALISGLALSAAVLLRLSALGCLIPIGLYLVSDLRRAAPASLARRAILWGAPVLLGILAIAWYDTVRFGSALETGYSYTKPGSDFSNPILSGVAGLLISPGKSLFLFSPTLCVGSVGTLLLWRRERALALTVASIAAFIVALHAPLVAWAGDWAWGPRYLLLLLPFLALPVFTVLQRWRRLGPGGRVAVVTVTGLGFLVQVLAVSLDFLHQHLLQVQDGVSVLTYWRPEYSAVWRHTVAFAGLLTGTARYPATFAAAADLADGHPVLTTWDFWWVYGWQHGVNHAVIAVVLGISVLLAARFATRLSREMRATDSS
jgi:hypothetical protein